MHLAGQDDLRSEKAQADYQKEAAQYMNQAERAGANSAGGETVMLAFLTRGKPNYHSGTRILTVPQR